jgi:hypothetical protein
MELVLDINFKQNFMTMNRLLIFALLLIISSCSRTTIGKIYEDERADFSQFESFSFAKTSIENQTALEPKMDNIERLKMAIVNEMKSRGYKEEIGGDLIVNLGIVMDIGENTRTTSFQDAPRYMGQRNYHWESEEIVTGTYERGTVIVDIVDAKANKLIWEGSASKVITDNQSKMADRIDDGINDLFKKYPVKPLKNSN